VVAVAQWLRTLDLFYPHTDNETSLRVLAKAPGVRRVDDELYELTADALGD
jgi:hypothetical protein